MSFIRDDRDERYWIGQRLLSHYANMKKYERSTEIALRQLQMLDRKYEGMSLEAAYKYTFYLMPSHVKKKFEKEEE